MFENGAKMFQVRRIFVSYGKTYYKYIILYLR